MNTYKIQIEIDDLNKFTENELKQVLIEKIETLNIIVGEISLTKKKNGK